jgi:hypothetical protein
VVHVCRPDQQLQQPHTPRRVGLEFNDVVTGSLIHPSLSIQRLQSRDFKILLNLSFLLRSKYRIFLIETFSYLQHDLLAICTFFILNFLMIFKRIKNLHVANESCCKYKNISIKNTLYFERSKKDKFSKTLESLDRSRWMESSGWTGDPVTAWLVVGQSLNPSPAGWWA